MKRFAVFPLFLYALAMLAMSGEGFGADSMQESHSLLPACPDKPNCVSSLSDRPEKRVEPFIIKGKASGSLRRLEEIVRLMPRTTIVSRDDRRLQAEFRTRLGFVDDVLSASRTGFRDFGVNRRRVERIREKY